MPRRKSLTGLDQPSRFARLDPKGVRASVALMGQQILDGWKAAERVRIPVTWRTSRSLVICGMGGSALGPDVLRAVFQKKMSVSATIVNGYEIPAWVGRETVVLAMSYSGTTEETLACAAEAKKRKARLLVAATGGTLVAWARKSRVPSVVMPITSNPAGQPRLATGLMLGMQLRLLARLGWIRLTPAALRQAVARVELTSRALAPTVPTTRNRAKQAALSLRGHFVLVIAAEHLAGAAHVLANQFNETAKTFAAPFTLPELNHHLLEGLTYPRAVRQATAVFLTSRHYSVRVQKRVALTETMMRRQHLASMSLAVASGTALEEALATVALSGWVTYYLGIVNGVDPVRTDWVNAFKRALAR